MRRVVKLDGTPLVLIHKKQVVGGMDAAPVIEWVGDFARIGVVRFAESSLDEFFPVLVRASSLEWHLDGECLNTQGSLLLEDVVHL